MTTTTWLAPGETLTVTAPAAGSGTLTRLADQPGGGEDLGSETVGASASVSKGPYSVATRWSFPDTLSYSITASGGGHGGGTHEYPSLGGDGAHFIPRDVFAIFDDFIQQTLTEADTPWILNSGTDAEAIDPAINAQAGGVLRLTSGDAGTGVAADGAQIVCHVPMQADSGGLVFETRLHINTAVTTVQVAAGFTDVTTLELPASVGALDAITTNFSDGCAFVYDTGAVTDQWFAVGVDSNTDATGNGATGIAPVEDVYQTLRIEIDADGVTARFYINGALVKSLTAAAASPGVDLFATVIVNATTTTSRTVDVDYIYAGHNR